MILQSLVKYYEILAEDDNCDIPKQGFSKSKVSYSLVITEDGKLIDIDLLKRPDSKGKKYIPREMEVPEKFKKTSEVSANFLCDNSSYVLGFDNKGKPKRSKECFLAFKSRQEAVLKKVDCEEARAVLAFLEKWDVDKAAENPLFTEYLNDFYAGANFVFRLDGKTPFVHENSMIKKAWVQYKTSLSEDSDIRQCLVTGTESSIARLHQSIKGINGGQPMGNALVSFNDISYESYGNVKGQGLNAPVSEYAAFAYGTVLNRMLSDISHRMIFGDSTLVFWAESPQSNLFQDMFSLMFDPDEIECIGTDKQKFTRNPAAVENIKSVFQKISQGKKISSDFKVDENTRFYVLALSPNAARISIRFFLCDSFGAFMKRIEEHYENLAIEHDDKEKDSISVSRLLLETVAPTSEKKSSSPLLSGSVLRSILSGLPYPAALFNSVMTRIRAEKNINYVKAAIIKAYLLKLKNNANYNKYKEILTMSLNDESDYIPYVLGRLFAALEKTQQDASTSELKSTIKDRYFTSACANPRLVFPTLLKLSNHHISKAEYGWKNEEMINNILQLIKMKNENTYPARLTLDEQGVFVLGYYHQKNQIANDIKAMSEAKKKKQNEAKQEGK
jgi:CRISPR-associated protein Csd1